MATCIGEITVKVPRTRLLIFWVSIRLLSPFVRSEATGQRIGDALFAWVSRGLRIYVNGRRA